MIHRRVLERSGLVESVDVATDGQKALDILAADQKVGQPLPELILLDVNMPGRGGFEFLFHYNEMQLGSKENLIIVMLSTSLLEDDYAKAKADPHVHCFCDKPLHADTVATLVAELDAVKTEKSTAN